MRCFSLRFLLTSVCFVLPCVVASSTSEAGVIPWVYNTIFGPSPGRYSYSYYGPSYYGPGAAWGGGGCGQVVTYRPVYGRGCCDPCTVAWSPCGPVSGGCNLPTCTTTAATQSSGAAAASRSGTTGSKTYAEDDPNAPKPASGATGPFEPPTPQRESSSGFKPRTPAAAGGKTDEESREALKPSAPTSADESTKPGATNPKLPAPTPKVDDKDNTETDVKPTAFGRQKIAWAPVLQRRQVSRQPQHGSAYIVRLPAYPKTNDLRQPADESTIAKK